MNERKQRNRRGKLNINRDLEIQNIQDTVEGNLEGKGQTPINKLLNFNFSDSVRGRVRVKKQRLIDPSKPKLETNIHIDGLQQERDKDKISDFETSPKPGPRV